MTACLTTPREYMRLIEHWAPRIIDSRGQFEISMDELARLGSKSKLSAAERTYFRTISALVKEYEDRVCPPPVKGDASDRLRALVDAAGMSASDLGRLLGKRTLGSALLHGRRGLSKAHIRKLSAHFRLSADYFL